MSGTGRFSQEADSVNERERALTILNRVERDSAFAAPLLDAVGDSVSAHFVRTVVMGVLRWRLTLDFLIETVSERKITKIDPPVLQILRIGFYQLFDMRVPEYAV